MAIKKQKVKIFKAKDSDILETKINSYFLTKEAYYITSCQIYSTSSDLICLILYNFEFDEYNPYM